MKFEKGEIAISFGHSPWAAAKYGTECECTIFLVGPFSKGQKEGRYRFAADADYVIRMPDGLLLGSAESTLRKRHPPEQDDQAFTRWFKETILTDCAPSLEESMKTAQKNLASYTQEGSCGS